MYEAFFGLSLEPFSIATDPRFLYLSGKHKEALALLEHGLSRGASFVLLTGEIGAGKTTVWRRFLETLPANFDVANVVNPRLAVDALLARICQDLRVEMPAPGTPVDLIDALHGHLLLAHAQGRRTLIVIDEAQALSPAVMEQLRLLTNLDSSGTKLHVMLIGQPELRRALEHPQLEPLAQRIVARYHLNALSGAETVDYVEHRLRVAGLIGRSPFDPEALILVHRLSRGIPRRINVLCDRALLAACEQGEHRVDARAVERAAVAVLGQLVEPAAQAEAEAVATPAPAAPADVPATPPPAGWRSAGWPVAWAIAGIAAAGVGVGAWLGSGHAGAPSRPVLQAAAPAPAGAAPVAPVAGPVAAAPVGASLDAVFDAPAAADEGAAWRRLAVRWGVSLPAGEPCAVAPALALFCYRSRDGLAPIRQLDRPGLLRLVDARGRVAFVLLTALGAERATLDAQGADFELPLTQLAQMWRGEYATLWRAPPGYREGEVPDGTGSLGQWLGLHLAQAGGSAAPAGASLRDRVFSFQLTHGLVPDGLAGPLTMMQLNRASGVDEPRLGLPR